MSQILMKLIWD